MFEMETERPRSNNSSVTGASSDVTSTSNNEQLRKFEDIIKRLETENKALQGRIRGYKTLGDLLQEAKAENKKLSEDKKKLEEKLDTTPEVKTSLGHVVVEPAQSVSGETETEHARLSTTATTDVTEPAVTTLTMTERSVTSTNDNTQDISEEMQGSIREVRALQESMVDTQNDLSRSLPKKMSSTEVNITPNLEPDSDRYEEPEYEKVGRKMVRRSGPASESMTSMSVISSGPDDKYTFPSLSSGTPARGQETDQKTYNDFDTKPMSSGHDTELSFQMNRLLQLQVTAEEPDLVAKFRKMSDDIAKTEEDVKRYKNLAYTFAQENQKLKTSLTMELKQCKNKNFELREENKRLLTRIKRLEHDRDMLPVNNESLTSQTRLQGWVTVEKPKEKGNVDSELFQQNADDESLTDDMDSVMANLRQLKKQNKELKAANQSWNKRWQELTQQWEVRTEHMRAEVGRYKAEAEEMRRKERQLQSDCERMVQNAKSQAHEEESAKEEALNQLHQSTAQNRALQDQLSELKLRLDVAVREGHNVEAELRVLKSQPMRQGAGRDRSSDEMKTEIEVLRQQLTVFEEDFDRERQDRAAAQSAREELQTNFENVMTLKEGLDRKVKTLEQKVRNQESNLQQTLRQNENLMTHNRDLQQQIQRSKDNLQQYQTAAYQQMRYNPMMMPGYNPQNQMGGGFLPQSPQHPHYNQPFMPMNAQVPFMNYPAEQMAVPQTAPAHWECEYCTYQNIPSRSVCEMCGKIKRQTRFSTGSGSASEPVLMSRDVIHPPVLPQGEDVPDENRDLVTDDGLYH